MTQHHNRRLAQIGRAEELGSGIRNIRRYLPLYAKNSKFEMLEEDNFETILHFELEEFTETQRESVEKTVGKTVEKIIIAMENDPSVTIQKLTKITGLTRRGVEWNIDKLKKEGTIERIGSKKGGYWKVFQKNNGNNESTGTR